MIRLANFKLDLFIHVCPGMYLGVFGINDDLWNV